MYSMPGSTGKVEQGYDVWATKRSSSGRHGPEGCSRQPSTRTEAREAGRSMVHAGNCASFDGSHPTGFCVPNMIHGAHTVGCVLVQGLSGWN